MRVRSGNEIGPFRAIEESVVAHLTPSASRSDVYAWYSLLGSAGAAFGIMTCGWAIQHLAADMGWQPVDAYRTVFVGYAVLGLLKLVLVLFLTNKIEAEEKRDQEEPAVSQTSETTPLLGDDAADGTKPPSKARRGIKALLPEISRESRGIMVSLCLLFALDSLGSGLAPLYVLHSFSSVIHQLTPPAPG